MNRVLFFHPCNDFTGSTRVLANIIESDYSMQKVNVITINNKKGFLSLLDNVDIINIYIPNFRGKNIPLITSVVWRLHALILAMFYGLKFDTFYINTILPYYATIIAKLYGKKIVYHVHEKFIYRSLKIRIAEYIFNHVSAKRIYVSKYLSMQYRSKANCDEIIRYNTLPHSFLSKLEIVPIEFRKRNSIIMIASLTKAKGIFTFIDVAKELPCCTFRLILSADMDSIKKYLSGFYMPDNLEIIPAQQDIHSFLKLSDLILNLSNPQLSVETFGMKILEAMAYGIPAIVPNVGGPLELIENGYNGYCIDVTKIDAIKQAITLALDKDNYNRLAINSLNHLKNFI